MPRKPMMSKLFALYPPKLHSWFLGKFPEPATWQTAHLAFTRTAAVWSMVSSHLQPAG